MTTHPYAAHVGLTDFWQVHTIFPAWEGQIEQTSSGRFEGKLQVVRGESVRALEIEGNQKLRMRGYHTAGMISVYPVTAGCAANVWHGRTLDFGRLVVHGPQAEVDHQSARNCSARIMSLRPEVLEAAARSLLGVDDIVVPKTNATYSLSTTTFSDLNVCLSHLLAQATAAPWILKSYEGRQFEQECVRALVMALRSTGPTQSNLALPARSRLLRRAEEFMRSRLTTPVGAIDLCQELGVNDRTLRLAFLERHGVGPMTYFRFLRLNAVRLKLQTNREIAIAVAAREFGFHHLGNFAADYRRLFGMRPSETERE